MTEPTSPFPVVVITGPVGVGKTTTAVALSELMTDLGLSHTLIGMDALTATWPRSADDSFNERLGLRNLADVVRNGREAGSERLIVAAVVESREGRERYHEAIPGAEVTVIRLVAPIEHIRERIAARNSIAGWSEAGVSWEKDRAAELIAIMDTNDVADVIIDTTDRSPNDTAQEIAQWLGWLPERTNVRSEG